MIHGVQGIPVIPSPTEDAIDLEFRFLLKTEAHTGLWRRLLLPYSLVSSCPCSLTDPSNQSTVFPLIPPSEPLRNHHELALWTLATSDVRQPQGEAHQSRRWPSPSHLCFCVAAYRLCIRVSLSSWCLVLPVFTSSRKPSWNLCELQPNQARACLAKRNGTAVLVDASSEEHVPVDASSGARSRVWSGLGRWVAGAAASARRRRPSTSAPPAARPSESSHDPYLPLCVVAKRNVDAWRVCQ